MKSLFPSLLFLSILSIEYASSTFLHTESYTKVCTSTRTFNFSFISSFSWAPRISWSKYSFIFWTFSEYSLNFLFLTENWLSPEENTYSAELSLGRCFYFHNLLTSDGVGVFFAPISCFHSIVPSPYWQTPCFCAISPSLPCIVFNILITLLHDLVTVVNEGSLCKSRQRLQYSGLHDLHILRDILHLSTSVIQLPWSQSWFVIFPHCSICDISNSNISLLDDNFFNSNYLLICISYKLSSIIRIYRQWFSSHSSC